MKVAVIDAGGANLGSVMHALGRLGVQSGGQSMLTSAPDVIRDASHVILPGVGAAGWAMEALRQADLLQVVSQLTQPVLGICLGLQLLFEHSTEGDAPCLGILPGRVQRLQPNPNERLPHMGWNQLQWRSDDPLAKGLSSNDWFYFVHTFGAPIGAHTLATSTHGKPFAAVVRHRNFVACQFHPEKSAAAGAKILENFLTS